MRESQLGGEYQIQLQHCKGGHVSQFIFSPITLYGLICESQLGGGYQIQLRHRKGGGAWISINFLT